MERGVSPSEKSVFLNSPHLHPGVAWQRSSGPGRKREHKVKVVAPWGRYARSRRVPPPSPRVLLRTRQEGDTTVESLVGMKYSKELLCSSFGLPDY